MGLETVIEGILSRGHAEAGEIRRAAEAERAKLLEDARAQGAKLLAEREQDARQAASRARVQELARAELESKKIVLAAQKALLDEVYGRVREGLGALAEGDAFLRRLLETSAEEWRDGKVYCRAKDVDVVKPVVGPRFGGTIDCIGGIVIESEDGSRKTDLRYETLLDDVWRESIREVVQVLWPSS